MTLPSFRRDSRVQLSDAAGSLVASSCRSGCTPAQPALLRYSLRLKARVMPCAAMRVSGSDDHVLGAVLSGLPLLTLSFDDMSMAVEKPELCAPPQPARIALGKTTVA